MFATSAPACGGLLNTEMGHSMDLGDFMWSLFVIFFMVIYFMILFSIIGDLFRSHDLNGVSKAIWCWPSCSCH